MTCLEGKEVRKASKDNDASLHYLTMDKTAREKAVLMMEGRRRRGGGGGGSARWNVGREVLKGRRGRKEEKKKKRKKIFAQP